MYFLVYSFFNVYYTYFNGSIECTSYFTFWKCFPFTESFRKSSTCTVSASGYTEHILKRRAVNSKEPLCSRPLPAQMPRACPQPHSSPLSPRLRMRDSRVPLYECHHYIQWVKHLFFSQKIPAFSSNVYEIPKNKNLQHVLCPQKHIALEITDKTQFWFIV